MNEPITTVVYPEDFKVVRMPKGGGGFCLSLCPMPGGVLLKIAKQVSTGERFFDWSNAITFLFSPVEIAGILLALKTKTKADYVHDSSLSAASKSDAIKGFVVQYNAEYKNFFWSLNAKENGVSKNVGVPTNEMEEYCIQILLSWSLPRILRWDLAVMFREEDKVLPGQKRSFAPRQPQEAPFEDNGEGYDLGSNVPPPGFEAYGAPPQTPTMPPVATPIAQKQTISPPVAQSSPQEKYAQILMLAKSKLGATTDDDAKMKVMEITNIPFIESKYDSIIQALAKK